MERKHSFSFDTSMMDVGTPSFAHGFMPSPAKTQPPSPEQPTSSCAKEAHKMNPWASELKHDELFCFEELV
jgi:hypothetical protein